MVQSSTVFRTTDWSPLPEEISVALKNVKNFSADGTADALGIHYNHHQEWTGAYVGVRNLRIGSGAQSRGKISTVTLIVEPRFGIDPWRMLEEVFLDDELDVYLESAKQQKRPLFKVFVDEKPVTVPTSLAPWGNLLLYLSFVNSCYEICRRGLKRNLTMESSNFSAKIRGKINVSMNLKKNTLRGRNDRFYCEYPVFSEDNLENRVLKFALIKAARGLKGHTLNTDEIKRRIAFSLSVLKNVRDIKPSRKDFMSVSATGLYAYYQASLNQAALIIAGKFGVPADGGALSNAKNAQTLPYAIDMQQLFELYSRKVLKDSLPDSLYLASYQEVIKVRSNDNGPKKLHLIRNLKPDLLVLNRSTKNVEFVFDVKYKQSDRVNREDTLQLLAYSFVCAPSGAGFFFPGKISECRQESRGVHLGTPYLENGLPYREFMVGIEFKWQLVVNGLSK